MRAFLLLLVLLVPACPALAQNAPIPQKKEINQLDEKLRSSKADSKALEADLKTIEKELDSTKGSLVSTAKAIQKNEKKLQNLDLKIADLEKEQKGLSAKLQNDRGSISRLILALERIRRLPPEALIVRPEAPLETAQSAMLLEEILPALHTQATELKNTLEKLQTVSRDLQDKRADVVEASKKLEAQQRELNSMVQKRRQLYASTQKDLAAQQKNIQKISAQAKNLADLVSRLDEERTRSQRAAPPSAKRLVGRPPPNPGAPRLPLPGIIKTGYNEPDIFGAPSKGLDIEGRAGALVVAPMGGIVRFAGYFKNYGNMVILEHQDGWHSLIAGLENIDTVVGQSLNVGEPLGKLHKSTSGQKPVLYYELRHKGKAVNPAKKFGDLS
ncbi:MAG: peptidoglycan DD-metalloendopeptidase family protein [Rhodospirillales bacterium]|nr:peptidoglycan DD-metalloendopeptidase family protein [Rhodospirillales bacterium]